MNIILGTDNIANISERYTVLPLDKFRVGGESTPVQSYCLVENLPIGEMFQLDTWLDLHKNLMVNYERQNWLYCEQAIEHLKGKWNGELDSFYDHLQARIKQFQEQPLPEDWSPVIDA